MQTILVTGGAGYIGSHTVVELLAHNYQVVIVDNFCNSSPKVLERIEQISGKQPIFYQADVLDQNALANIFKQHKIDEVAIEDIFYAYNPQTVLKLAQFRGALSLKILQVFGNFSEYTPLQVKKAVTGNGKAAKEQVAFMVKKILGIKQEIKPLDISDAIAIAITHAQRIKVN